MSYAAKLVMHLNYGRKGSSIVRELIDFPGVVVTDNYGKNPQKHERIIRYMEVIYPNLDAAVAAWREKNGTGKINSNNSSSAVREQNGAEPR